MAVIDTAVLVQNVKNTQSQIVSIEAQAQPLVNNINTARRQAEAAMSAVKPDKAKLIELKKQIATLKKSLAADARKLKILEVKVT